jgi:DNA polymerase
MIEKMLRMDAIGVELIGSVRVEIIARARADDAEATLTKMIAIMSEPPAWAGDLPLAARGYANQRYMKP